MLDAERGEHHSGDVQGNEYHPQGAAVNDHSKTPRPLLTLPV